MSVQHIFWILLWLWGGNSEAWQYPGDEGIKEHPSVLVADNFETGELEDLENKWGYVSNRNGEVLSFSNRI